MTERVIDASVLAYAFIGKTSKAESLRGVLRGTDCHAPHLIDAELGNVLRRRVRAGDVSQSWTWRDDLSFYDAL